ncbi:hypothetical protein SUNI508_07177 [Seiridium unicorne]|uniref:GST N-terminal domain-containing protein n=1 Tax=Seiridium unicorne TaxID=138068 RepID=A0ABR2UZ79_9PEZI
MAEKGEPLECTLYIFPFSLYSIIARFAATLGAYTDQSNTSIVIEHRLVNVHRDENIDEPYLLGLNPKGQIPTMTVEGLSSPIADSLDISYWICQIYPKLLPEKHQSKIQSLLSQLHSIEALSLSAARPEHEKEDVVNPACDNALARTDISEPYRRALEYKKEVDRGHILTALYHENIKRAEEQARALFESVNQEYQQHHDAGPWIFGDEVGPTVLDAHIVPFITRVGEAGRARLIPDDLRQYARHIVTLPQWLEVTHGRRTLWNVSYGHVHLLSNI